MHHYSNDHGLSGLLTPCSPSLERSASGSMSAQRSLHAMRRQRLHGLCQGTCKGIGGAWHPNLLYLRRCFGSNQRRHPYLCPIQALSIIIHLKRRSVLGTLSNGPDAETSVMLNAVPCCAHADLANFEQKVTSWKPSIDSSIMEITVHPSSSASSTLSPQLLRHLPIYTDIDPMAFVCNSKAAFRIRTPCWISGLAP